MTGKINEQRGWQFVLYSLNMAGMIVCLIAPGHYDVVFFDKAGCMERLEGFTSEFGAKFYGLKPNDGFITLERREHEVPAMIYGAFESGISIVPFKAGEKLDWRVI